jgi:CelD/BcsL family acetyltransferase involved in cellulose biosynthesis
MLYLDGIPVAFWTGTAYAATFATGAPGFDPDFAKDAVGRFTMLRMFEDLCADPFVSAIDFGHGEADYKSAFGHCERHECAIFLTSRRLYPIALTLIMSAFSLINNQGRRFARDAKWGRWLKKRWRRALQDSTTTIGAR